MAAHPCQCRNCHFKMVNFMSCELHLKASFKKTIRLEGYRDDQHGPCARMTRKFAKRSIFKRKKTMR